MSVWAATGASIHDFMLLNALSDTKATRAAIREAIAQLRKAFGTT